MKRKLMIFFIASVVTLLICSVAVLASGEDVHILINNNGIKFSIPPYVKDEEVFLPMREIFELYGFEVNWNGTERSAEAAKDGKIVKVKVGSNIVKLYGEDYNSKDDVFIFRDRIFISTDVIEAGLNIKVKWDKNKRTIYLNEYTNESITIVGNDNSVILGSNILVNISPRYDIDTVNKIIGENDEMLVEKNYTGAIRGYKELLKHISAKENPEEYIHVLINLGNAYVELASIVNREQNALEAILFYEEALKVDSIDKYPHKKALANRGMGSAYFILSTVRDVEKNTAKALEMFNEALNIFVKDGDQYNCGYLHYLKGRTYYWMAASTNTRDNIIKSLDSLEEGDCKIFYVN
ncbi:stalk domain-containing protein [Acetivibrio thermocellus]|uniref:stalk domain-containing protein n=1 Tax=Acetivibrio thermocellus TaxID=1515 RepID=UPI0021ADE5C9|nr:stalk domain-containing protein [Acetivibrio thermocellus]UWV46519.1 stalk domain-containing protein [Acetivibrio thermocellus]